MSPNSSRRALGVLIVLLGAFVLPLVVVGAGRPTQLSGTVDVLEQAVRVVPDASSDLVSVYNSGALNADVERRAIRAADDAGAEHTVRQAASIGMVAVTRGDEVVQSAPSGFAYPMGTTVLERSAVEALMGPEVAEALSDDTIVMSRLTASLRGAAAGDEVTLVASTGEPVRFTLGAVIDDAVTGGTELLMAPDAATRLALERKSSVVIWDFADRGTIDRALDDNDLISTDVRIRRSWDPFDPDSTLGMARAKEMFGEFAYRVNADGTVSIDEAWKAEHLPDGRVLLDPVIRISARCHHAIAPALRAALADVAEAGLGWTFDVYDANRAGGCYNPRFSRLTPDSSIGFLSRHTWAIAIDTNTIGSCQGCIPDIHCDAVRIFREHGFAWGGNFLRPDGMHFEFVGEARDGFVYPSRFCRNEVSGRGSTQGQTLRPTIFADSGLITEAHH